MNINGKVISVNGTKEGLICTQPKNFNFENLIIWVHRNCPAPIAIKVEEKEVSAIYEDRIEVYNLVKKDSVK